jgi:phage FluMu gp28-like protein
MAKAPTILTRSKTSGSPLLPYQRRWVNDESPMKLGDKSRRTGWTWAEAYDAVARRYRGTQPRMLDYWFSSADESAAYEFIEYCRFFAKELFGKIADIATEEVEAPELRKGTVTAFVCRCPNGKRITAMSSNPTRFRSKGGDVRLDEAAFHRDAEAMHDAASPATTWGGTYATWSTPNGEGSLFNRFVQRCRKVLAALGLDPDAPQDVPFATLAAKARELNQTPVFSYHKVTILDAIAQGIVEKINAATGGKKTHADFLAECRAKSRSEDGYLQEYMCVASADAFAWLTYQLIEACEHELVPQPGEALTGYTGGPCFAGVDVGRTHDLTYVPICEEVGDVLWPRQILVLKNLPIPQQTRTIAAALRNVRLTRVCVDYTGVGVGIGDGLVEALGDHCVENIQSTNRSQEAIAVGLKTAMEDKLLRLPADNQSIRDGLHKVKKTVTATGKPRFEAPRDDEGHADEFWGFGYAVEAASNAGGFVNAEFTPAGYTTFGRMSGW